MLIKEPLRVNGIPTFRPSRLLHQLVNTEEDSITLHWPDPLAIKFRIFGSLGYPGLQHGRCTFPFFFRSYKSKTTIRKRFNLKQLRILLLRTRIWLASIRKTTWVRHLWSVTLGPTDDPCSHEPWGLQLNEIRDSSQFTPQDQRLDEQKVSTLLARICLRKGKGRDDVIFTQD